MGDLREHQCFGVIVDWVLSQGQMGSGYSR